jgi:hypothetical protein
MLASESLFTQNFVQNKYTLSDKLKTHLSELGKSNLSSLRQEDEKRGGLDGGRENPNQMMEESSGNLTPNKSSVENLCG